MGERPAKFTGESATRQRAACVAEGDCFVRNAASLIKIQNLLGVGLNNIGMRDELYLQVMKQISGNPSQ